jgi:hypothetical protein
MQQTLAILLQHFIDRVELPVSRVSSQAGIPRQTLFNWLNGRTPRWHPQLPADLARLSLALGLTSKESDDLLLAAGCVCAVDTPYFEETTMNALTLPSGWFRAGSHPAQYEMGLDPSVACDQAPSALIRSNVKQVDGFGTLMQSCKPGDFLGKRVRLSAMARTEEVQDWAGLWFRIDGPVRGESLNFDNMQDRPLKETKDWERYSIVLDVPMEAIGIAFGVLLSNVGSVWIADMLIEITAPDTPTTNLKIDLDSLPEAPVNLKFDQ